LRRTISRYNTAEEIEKVHTIILLSNALMILRTPADIHQSTGSVTSTSFDKNIWRVNQSLGMFWLNVDKPTGDMEAPQGDLQVRGPPWD
jgi:hypothetical protein